MTLLSHKNRQTTRPNIRRWKASDFRPLLLAALVFAALSGGAFADDANGERAVGKSPLDRLRLRSAFARWDELKQRLSPIAKPPMPSDRRKPISTRQPMLLPVPDLKPAKAATSVEAMNVPLAVEEALPIRKISQPGGKYPDDSIYAETTIREILPFFDYEPTDVAEQEQDCQTICPCPEGSDCRKTGGTKPCPCPETFIRQPWVAKTYSPRAFEAEAFNWDASNIYSHPLYFEDKTLERYGHAYCSGLQPFASVLRFSGQLALLPYQMAFKPPRQRRYQLGYYRPGEWAPKLHYQIPLNTKATLVQGSVISGAFLIFP